MSIKVTEGMLQCKYSTTVTQGDDPKERGKADSRFFNRKELFEVIDMLQDVADAENIKTKDEIHKLEKTLQQLPGTTRRREDVFDWLVKNYQDIKKTQKTTARSNIFLPKY